MIRILPISATALMETADSLAHAHKSGLKRERHEEGGARMRSSRRGLLATFSAWLLLAPTVVHSRSGASIEQGFIHTASGIEIHYLQSGDVKSTRALILIPGWRLPAYLWEKQLEAFSKRMRVIALDPRSQGESTKTPDGDTPEGRAVDLREVLAGLKVSQCVLVGWSQGAQDVAAYLQKFGTDSVSGVVFVDSPVSRGPSEIELHKEFSKIILSNMAAYANHPEEFSNGMVHSIVKKPHAYLDLDRIVRSTLQTPTAV